MSELARELLALLGEAAPADLAAAIDAGLARVRARWPDAPPPGTDFIRHVVERARRQPDLAAALPRLRLDDAFLAWWAGGGDARAIAAFEAAHAALLDRLLARFHRLDADELRQQLRIKLFTGAPPRIFDYAGFGFLENWLKVLAARTFLDAARAAGRTRTDDVPDELLLELAAPGGHPGDAAARAEVVAAIKRALEVAILGLAGRERTFLRHVTVDGLTLDQVAATYQVHRVTVARALAAARAQLHTATRARVVAELGVAPERLASALRLLDSQIDLSLQRLFPEPTM
ncbi:MAG TPA: hypothetical protein VGC42_04740 [Kofleriaceae bacterium]